MDAARIAAAVAKERGRATALFDAVRRAYKTYHVAYASADDLLGKIIVHTDGGDDAGTYWMVDMATGKAGELDESYPLVRPENVGPTQLVRYKAADGLEIEAVLTLPPGRRIDPESCPGADNEPPPVTAPIIANGAVSAPATIKNTTASTTTKPRMIAHTHAVCSYDDIATGCMANLPAGRGRAPGRR